MISLLFEKMPREDLLTAIVALYPEWPTVAETVRAKVPPNNKEVWPEQAAAIAYLASQFVKPRTMMLEFGTNRGYTAAVLAAACPAAQIVSLEPDPEKRKQARQNLAGMPISVRPQQSTAWLEHTADLTEKYDLIFVDGDHKNIEADLPWWGRLKVGGLFLHHDYSPDGSDRPCPPVYEALNRFSLRLGRPMDVLISDSSGVGLGGWYRRAKEPWPLPEPAPTPRGIIPVSNSA